MNLNYEIYLKFFIIIIDLKNPRHGGIYNDISYGNYNYVFRGVSIEDDTFE